MYGIQVNDPLDLLFKLLQNTSRGYPLKEVDEKIRGSGLNPMFVAKWLLEKGVKSSSKYYTGNPLRRLYDRAAMEMVVRHKANAITDGYIIGICEVDQRFQTEGRIEIAITESPGPIDSLITSQDVITSLIFYLGAFAYMNNEWEQAVESEGLIAAMYLPGFRLYSPVTSEINRQLMMICQDMWSQEMLDSIQRQEAEATGIYTSVAKEASTTISDLKKIGNTPIGEVKGSDYSLKLINEFSPDEITKEEEGVYAVNGTFTAEPLEPIRGSDIEKARDILNNDLSKAFEESAQRALQGLYGSMGMSGSQMPKSKLEELEELAGTDIDGIIKQMKAKKKAAKLKKAKASERKLIY